MEYSMDFLHQYAEIIREIDDKMSVSVKLSYLQVRRIIVADLLSKYYHNKNARESEWTEHFEKVLEYYLGKEELAMVIDVKMEISVPCPMCDGSGEA